MRTFDADAVAALGPALAADAIAGALMGGLDPALDPARTAVGLAHGEFLLMPSQTATAAGVKVITVAPDNQRRDLPRIHGLYLLFDAQTLVPTALIDGAALTALRTPAVTVAAVRHRLPARPLRLALVGAGPQAVAHEAAFRAARPLQQVAYLVRDPSRAPVPGLALDSAEARGLLQEADVVVCATTARTPLFEGDLVADGAIVVAVGSHEPDARELDPRLLARSTVVVEDVATALREAGDVVMAVREGHLRPESLVSMRQLIVGNAEAPGGRPMVFKSVGMAWEDLAVAEAVARDNSG